jgi:hypothetical protein
LDFNDAFGCKIRRKVCFLFNGAAAQGGNPEVYGVIATMGNTSASAAIIKTARAVAAPVRYSGWASSVRPSDSPKV